MHVLKICAALAAIIYFGPISIAAAQIESSPAFRETPKKKAIRKALLSGPEVEADVQTLIKASLKNATA